MRSMQDLLTRRRFMLACPVAGVTLLGACSRESGPVFSFDAMAATRLKPAAPASAAAAPVLLAMADEKSPRASVLGYVENAATVNKARFTAYAEGNQCRNCAFYWGAANEASGRCPLFPGKHVAAGGWCNSWVRAS